MMSITADMPMLPALVARKRQRNRLQRVEGARVRITVVGALTLVLVDTVCFLRNLRTNESERAA